MHPRLLLASTSPYRAQLLERLGLPFEVQAPGVAETRLPREAPRARALRLAHAKAAAVAASHPDACVIGSDQVAALGRSVLDRPGDAQRCREQLLAASGKRVAFHTAVVLVGPGEASARSHVDRTLVSFRTLNEHEVARYVDIEKPFDCAGSFRSEGLGISLFESIDTRDPAALVGLPLIWLAGALRAAGLDPLAPDRS
jgi:septum formation protein